MNNIVFFVDVFGLIGVQEILLGDKLECGCINGFFVKFCIGNLNKYINMIIYDNIFCVKFDFFML